MTTATELHFVIDGIHLRTGVGYGMRDSLGYLAASQEEAVATCQRLNPAFEILRVRLIHD